MWEEEKMSLLVITFCIIFILIIIVFYLIIETSNVNKINKKLTDIINSSLNMVKSYERRGGFKQDQIDMMRKKILVDFGKDLNEIQVLSIMIAWRDSYDMIGGEQEFIEEYIKEKKW